MRQLLLILFVFESNELSPPTPRLRRMLNFVAKSKIWTKLAEESPDTSIVYNRTKAIANGDQE